ncbi:MAG TPA: DUF2934 domain-containing protein [Candidatus Acidoferrales bacterium]|nr:DUF2934 domain-containing protein [Candidatus Acidoferrales bacterium]
MASKICCPEGHSTKAVSVWEAAVALSDGRAIGACKKCGKGLQYRIEHVYAADPDETEHTYIVTRAVRLGKRPTADEQFDPFLLVVREIDGDKEQILPIFWAFGQTAAPRAGYLSPILSAEDWKKLFKQAGVGFEEPQQNIRERAYQLYEQRGRRNGYALQDWLQAEAEIAGRTKLRVAA